MATTKKTAKSNAGSNSATEIKSSIERYERLQEEKDEISSDQRELMAEVKSNGFDVKTIRRIIRERRQDKAKRKEEEAIYDTYAHAIGHGDFEEEE